MKGGERKKRKFYAEQRSTSVLILSCTRPVKKKGKKGGKSGREGRWMDGKRSGVESEERVSEKGGGDRAGMRSIAKHNTYFLPPN